MNRAALAGLLAGALALCPAGCAPAMAEGIPSVELDAPAAVAANSDFTVSINISDVAAFDAGQFDVSFDESLVELEDVTAGQMGATEIPVDIWNKMSAGTCRIIVNVPGFPGVSGPGSLAVLHFHAADSAAGASSLDLSNGFLNTNQGVEIAATWTGDSVTVGDNPTPSTPDPGSPDSENPEGAAARTPVFRWWVLGVIIGGAAVLIAATVAGVLWRRARMMRPRDS